MQYWLFWIVILTIHLVRVFAESTVSEILESGRDFSPINEEKFPLVTTPVYDVAATKTTLSNDGDFTTSTGKGSSILRPPSTAFPKEVRTVTMEGTVNKRKKPGRNRTRTGVSPKKNSTIRNSPDSYTTVLPKEDYISSSDNPKVIPTSGQLNDNPYFHGSSDLERPFAFGRGGSARDEQKGKPTTTSPDPKVEPFGQVLGVPDWKLAKKQWGIAWHIHIYATGPLFAGLVFLGCLNLLRLKASTKLLGIGYYVTLNVLVVVLGLSRAFYLLFDSYNSGGSLPSPIPCCLYDLAHPCLSTALAVLFLALIKETKLDFFPSCARRPGILAAHCILHFALTLTLDVISGLTLEAEKSSILTGILLLVSRLVFVVWTMILVVSYFAAFKRLRKAALRKQGEMIRVTFTKLHIDGAQLPKKLPKPTLALSVNVALLAAFFGAGLVLTRVYGIAFVDGPIMVGEKLPDPWPWWIYHLVSRFFEILSCAAVIFVASQPLRNFETARASDRDSDSFVPRRLPRPFSFRCCRKEVDVDLDDSYDAYFSNHLVHYNNRGFRNSGFSHSLEGHHRRWDNHRTNSLPPFDQTRPNGQHHHQSSSTDKPNNPRGTSGGHTRDHSTMPVQRLSSGITTDKVVPVNPVTRCQIISGTSRSNRSIIENMAACGTQGSAKIPPIVPPHATIDSNLTTSSSGRPTSMLFKDNGFIRFRREDDPEQPMELSDETTEEDASSVKDGDSILAQAGSGTHSLCESDFVQSTLSPFFQHFGQHQHHHQPHHCVGPPRVKLFSRCSLDTLDNSGGDASSEQLSNVTSKNCHSNGALDCHSKRQGGSTCSSESAANSFDVTFYLQGLSRQSTPAIRSVSPLASCRRYHGVPTNLDLSKDPLPRGFSDGGVVNVACGTEDVTPDSAVFMDLHLSDDTDPIGLGNHALQRNEKPTYHRDNSAFDRSRSEEPPGSPVAVPWSHSLNDLSAFEVIRGWKTSKTWLNRLKGSSFSLNGYELLPPVDQQDVSGKPPWVRRVNSDRRKRSVEGTSHLVFSSMSDVVGQVKDGGHFLGKGMIQGDSGLLGDCQELQVDRAAQTDDNDNYPINSLFTRLRVDEKITAFNLIEERD